MYDRDLAFDDLCERRLLKTLALCITSLYTYTLSVLKSGVLKIRTFVILGNRNYLKIRTLAISSNRGLPKIPDWDEFFKFYSRKNRHSQQ